MLLFDRPRERLLRFIAKLEPFGKLKYPLLGDRDRSIFDPRSWTSVAFDDAMVMLLIDATSVVLLPMNAIDSAESPTKLIRVGDIVKALFEALSNNVFAVSPINAMLLGDSSRSELLDTMDMY
jgi:hypothetical protein